MGVRQLRHPVQGVRHARHARHRPGEDRRRREGAPVHRAGAEGRAAHPVGQGRRLSPSCGAYADDLGIELGTINSNTFQDDDYKLGSLTHADAAVRRKAIEHHLDCIEIMNQTGSRDLKIWLADGTNYPGQGDIRARQDRLAEASPRSTTGSAETSGWCWSTSSSSRRSTTPTCRTGARRTCRSPHSGPGRGVPGHRPPRAGHQHRVHRRATAATRKARFVRLQLPLLRRRRPHRRRGRSVPAVPDPVRGDPRRRLRGELARSPSCSTSATTSRPRFPARSGPC